jgi:adenylate cyclase
MAEERVQRRLAAILAADVVGYSRLMAQDEVGTLLALRARRKAVLEPLVSEHQGRIFKVTGDGVLVEFASAVNAVQCAVDLQHAMAAANGDGTSDHHILLRIGVNLGDVMVEGSDLYGDGVNIAARLEAIADPGGIIVSRTAFDHINNKVKVGFDDLGAQTLKNIAQPVRVYRVTGMPVVAVATTRSVSDKPSIAVLPFANLSGDPEQQYFSDGITEDIITELSRFQSLFVIARHSSFQFRNIAADLKRVGQELGVRYVLEGSIRKGGNRIRITGQLIDAETGNHLWAERYDRNLEQVFALQDEVAQMIASAMAVRLEDEDLARAKRKAPESMRAYDYWLRGKKCLDLWTSEGNHEARGLFEKAVVDDPAYARGYAGLAFTYEWGAFYTAWDPDTAASHNRASELAQRALSLDDSDHLPHVVLGWVHHERREFKQARQQFERAMAINPNDADTLMNAAMVRAFEGEPEQAIDLAQFAMRLNPRPPDWYLCYLAGCYARAGKYSEATALFERVPDAIPEVRGYLAALHVLQGHPVEARRHMDVFLQRYSQHWAGTPSAQAVEHVYSVLCGAEDPQHFMDALREAGLPE